MVRLELPEAILIVAHPSETALLEWVRSQVSEFELREIAANDYGEEVPEHLAGIKVQLSEAPELGLLPWCPREVLELERWQEPDRSYDDSPPKGRMGHLKRLLACAILLRNAAYICNSNSVADGDTLFFLDTSAATALRLARSAISIGAEAIPLALGFVVWTHSQIDYPFLTPFITFAILLLVGAGSFKRLTDRDSEDLSQILVNEELRARLSLGEDVNNDKWLTGLNLYEEDRESQWREAADRVFASSSESLLMRPKLAEVLRRLH